MKRFPKFGGAADRRRMEGLTARSPYPAPAPKAPYVASPPLFKEGDEVTCYAGTGAISAVRSDPEEGFQRTYVVDLRQPSGGTRRGFVNENSLTKVAPADLVKRNEFAQDPISAKDSRYQLQERYKTYFGRSYRLTRAGKQESVLLGSLYGSVLGGFVLLLNVRGPEPGDDLVRSFLLTIPLDAAVDLLDRQTCAFLTTSGEPAHLELVKTERHRFNLSDRVEWLTRHEFGTIEKLSTAGKDENPVYLVRLDSGRLQPIYEQNTRLLAPPTAEPAPDRARALRLAKAKVKVAAAAKAKAAAAVVPAGPLPDYDLSRTPEAWDIPAAWGLSMPAHHFAFLQEVNRRQRVVGGLASPGRWTPLKVAADTYGIREMHVVRELLELSTVHLARTTLLPLRRSPGAEFRPFLDRLVALYQRQFSLADLKTATSMLNQQYSTPGPLSAILGEWIARKHPQLLGSAYEGAMQAPASPYVLEPTAGNGLLTVRFDPAIVAVNELELTRLQQLQKQGFHSVSNFDAADKDRMYYVGGIKTRYLGVITNPPFGSTDSQLVHHPNGREGYRLNGWEHVIAAHAVNRLAPTGRAAIIIGGHHKYDDNGKLVGRDWIFFNWLYKFFNDVRVFQLDAHKLYARQGATWPIRVITLDGFGQTGSGYAPNGIKDAPLPLVSTFHQLAHQLGLILNSDA